MPTVVSTSDYGNDITLVTELGVFQGDFHPEKSIIFFLANIGDEQQGNGEKEKGDNVRIMMQLKCENTPLLKRHKWFICSTSTEVALQVDYHKKCCM